MECAIIDSMPKGIPRNQKDRKYCGICGGVLGLTNVIGFCRRTPECNRARQRAKKGQEVRDRSCANCGAKLYPNNLTGYCGTNLECHRIYEVERRKMFPLVPAWQGMKQRCYNPKNHRYNRYGARGITVYAPWIDDYHAFEAWVLENLGPRPAGMSLDRIDNDGNYEPGNLKWSDAKEQVYNRGAQGRSVEIIEALRAQVRELGGTPVI